MRCDTMRMQVRRGVYVLSDADREHLVQDSLLEPGDHLAPRVRPLNDRHHHPEQRRARAPPLSSLVLSDDQNTRMIDER